MLPIATNQQTNQFNNNLTLTKGALQFKSRNVVKVGTDNFYKFGEKIKLANGKPLEVSQTDYIFEFNLLTKHKGEIKIENIALPSSIFKQARVGNKILFSQKGKDFELKLAPACNNKFSFDECLNGFPKLGCNKASMYISDCNLWADDIPEGHHVWSKKDAITLSPKAERIQIGKAGCVPVDIKKLTRIGKDVDRVTINNHASFNDKNVIFLEIPGSIEEQQGNEDLRVFIDLIVDEDRLHVHAYYPQSADGFPSEKYYFINLDNGTKKIDKEKILAVHMETGIIKIELPYLPTQELIDSETDEDEPIDFEKEERKSAEKVLDWDWEAELSDNEVEYQPVSQIQGQEVDSQPQSELRLRKHKTKEEIDQKKINLSDEPPSNDSCCKDRCITM